MLRKSNNWRSSVGMKIVRTFIETLKDRETEVTFFYKKIKEEEKWGKRSIYFALLWQNVLAAVIAIFLTVMMPLLLWLIWIVGGVDMTLSWILFATAFLLLSLYLFELWILFLMRKVYPKKKEIFLKKLDNKGHS
ncbi:hypothetical protein [Halalkalibacter sp. APA_J-10(15)]|uniref:hypothetical protein n=1 Tax=Halalkalibacter sp. APA_J-10(15) TaxID=2933805 RepID=UPI001FF2CA32|nr:hypothetical protein [Halalkalibacter sp. APA_J-10(15)]MCK0473468.1 hypothetical protein [Halalkalibacter sp. APA_J-10(15)]